MTRPKWLDKQWLALKLVEYPLLRLLLFTFWFRLIFLLLIGAGIAFVLLFPKMWRMTPAGFAPVVRVSWLDLIQARSLRDSAVQAEQAGHPEDAYQAWLAAVANNPADTELLRGLLRFLAGMKGQARPADIRLAAARSFWLLELSKNQPADLDLAADLFNKYKLYELNASLIPQRGDLRRPSLQAHYIKALFHTGKMADFGEMWPKLTPDLAQRIDLSLYYQAWQAGWGSSENQAEAWRRLKEAQDRPETRTLSLDLQLAVSFQQSREENYAQALQSLAELREDTVMHHANYWKLLSYVGKKEEAIRLAQAYPRLPASPGELINLAEVNYLLGLKEQAKRLFDTYALEFVYSEQVWWAFGSFLMNDKQFDALIPLALQIRHEAQARGDLKVYSYFLEGVALCEQGRTAEAGEAFQKCAEYELANELLGLSMTSELLRRKFPQPAMRLLNAIEKSCQSNSYYWSLVSSAAVSLKDFDRLNRAVAQAYRLNPTDWTTRNNYAATLLAARTNPEAAISLTLPLMVENPESNAARINHALALLLNRRAAEARSLLDAIDPSVLNPSEASSYHLAWFQYYLADSQAEAARQRIAKIDRRYLMPVEERWLDQAAAQITVQQPSR